MSIKKPILKVKRECRYCKGSGSKTIKENYFNGKDILRYGIAPRKHCYVMIDCPKCNGTGYIDVKQNDPKFKKYYQKALEELIGSLTTEYRRAKAEAFNLGEELGKHCKELDKVVNK